MSRRLSWHDREAIADVAPFTTTDPHLPHLQAVWLTDGWAIATDSYRIDARQIDTLRQGPVTHDGTPVRLTSGHDMATALWNSVSNYTPRHDVTGLRLHPHDLPPQGRSRRLRRICLGCLAYTHAPDDGQIDPCACHAPLVDLQFLRQALQACGDAVTIRWSATRTPVPAVRIDEDDHFHLLMTVRRRGQP